MNINILLSIFDRCDTYDLFNLLCNISSTIDELVLTCILQRDLRYVPIPNNILRNSCKRGNRFLFDLAIEAGATDLCDALYYSCMYNRLELVDLLLERGVQLYSMGLYGACRGGHIELTKRMIGLIKQAKGIWSEKALTPDDDPYRYIWDCGMRQACYAGCSDIIDLMVTEGAIDWKGSFNFACVNNKPESLNILAKCAEENQIKLRNHIDLQRAILNSTPYPEIITKLRNEYGVNTF